MINVIVFDFLDYFLRHHDHHFHLFHWRFFIVEVAESFYGFLERILTIRESKLRVYSNLIKVHFTHLITFLSKINFLAQKLKSRQLNNPFGKFSLYHKINDLGNKFLLDAFQLKNIDAGAIKILKSGIKEWGNQALTNLYHILSIKSDDFILFFFGNVVHAICPLVERDAVSYFVHLILLKCHS